MGIFHAVYTKSMTKIKLKENIKLVSFWMMMMLSRMGSRKASYPLKKYPFGEFRLISCSFCCIDYLLSRFYRILVERRLLRVTMFKLFLWQMPTAWKEIDLISKCFGRDWGSLYILFTLFFTHIFLQFNSTMKNVHDKDSINNEHFIVQNGNSMIQSRFVWDWRNVFWQWTRMLKNVDWRDCAISKIL